jgi:anti-anti-sigma factor
VAISFVLIIMVLSLLLDRFGSSLRDALVGAMSRERDLEVLRASLEAQVSERTASLEQALRAGEQREADLARTVAELNTSRTTIRELSAPVIPVLPGVLVAPLVGALDEARTAEFARQVLTQVEREHAKQLIIDVTGVPVVDTHVAQTLLRTAEAVRLLGAQTLLVGVRPEVAQTIVALGAHLGDIPTYADLREAVATLVK